jgi:hypothetical protein
VEAARVSCPDDDGNQFNQVSFPPRPRVEPKLRQRLAFFVLEGQPEISQLRSGWSSAAKSIRPERTAEPSELSVAIVLSGRKSPFVFTSHFVAG